MQSAKDEIDRLLRAEVGAVYDQVDGFHQVRVTGYTDEGLIVLSQVLPEQSAHTDKITLIVFHEWYERHQG